jgi:hypothetical protein
MKLNPEIKSKKLEIEDIIIIIVISLIALITLNYIYTFIAFLFIFILMALSEGYSKKAKFRRIFDKLLNLLIVNLAFWILLDIILTYLGVNHYKTAYETNFVLIWLWDNFGEVFGWIIWIIFIYGVLSIFYIIKSINSKFAKIPVFLLLLLYNFIWIYAVIRNLILICS